jgi:hypothetical protein
MWSCNENWVVSTKERPFQDAQEVPCFSANSVCMAIHPYLTAGSTTCGWNLWAHLQLDYMPVSGCQICTSFWDLWQKAVLQRLWTNIRPTAQRKIVSVTHPDAILTPTLLHWYLQFKLDCLKAEAAHVYTWKQPPHPWRVPKSTSSLLEKPHTLGTYIVHRIRSTPAVYWPGYGLHCAQNTQYPSGDRRASCRERVWIYV